MRDCLPRVTPQIIHIFEYMRKFNRILLDRGQVREMVKKILNRAAEKYILQRY